MYQKFAFSFPDEWEIDEKSDLSIRHAFILTLPFRLRVGSLYSLNIGEDFRLVFRNKLNIPHRTPVEDVQTLMWKDNAFQDHEQFYTEVLIIDLAPKADSQYRQNLRRFLTNAPGSKLPEAKERYFEAITHLNDTIVAYHHATNSLFGGNVVERLTQPVFFERLRYVHTIVSPTDYNLSNGELCEILDARGDRQFTQIAGQFTLNGLDDAPPEELDAIQRYANLHQRFLFYQFALDAKSKMVEQDFISAILFAVVALEGAHSALLKMRLLQQLELTVPEKQEREKQAEMIAER